MVAPSGGPGRLGAHVTPTARNCSRSHTRPMGLRRSLSGLEPAPTYAEDDGIFRDFVNQLLDCYELETGPRGVFTRRYQQVLQIKA